MNEYRNKLKNQNILFIIGLLVLIAVQVLAFTRIIPPVSANENFADFWKGFIEGVAGGLTAIVIIGIILNVRALRSEKALKKLYVKETDERTRLIAVKGKSAGASAYLFCMLVVGIVSGFFNITVFFTLIASVFILSLFMSGGKLYYCKKL